MQNLKLGDLLTLQNHPFFTTDNEIIIGADDALIPPIMVAVEILNDHRSKDEFDEKTGQKITNSIQVKCLFYSHKSYKFESNWFQTDQLKQISIHTIEDKTPKIEALKDIDNYINKNVILKTWSVEIKKKKSFLSYTSGSIDKSVKISALLNFLPPVMTVIGVKKLEENKENNFDKKTGNPKRQFSRHLIKCRWFNPIISGFSEDYFNPNSIEIVTATNQDLIIKIEDIIKSKKYIKFNNKDIKYNNGDTIGLPLTITFNHCYHKLTYKDYLTNNNETINLTEFSSENFVEKDNYAKTFIPEYSEFKIETDIEEFLKSEFQEPEIVSTKIFRISYTNIEESKSIRTIINAKLVYDGNNDDFKNNVDDYDKKYIEAECCYRDGKKRYFKFNRINKIEVLDL